MIHPPLPDLIFMSRDTYDKFADENPDVIIMDETKFDNYIYDMKVMINNALRKEIIICSDDDRIKLICNQYSDKEYADYIKNNLKYSVDRDGLNEELIILFTMRIPYIVSKVEYRMNNGIDIVNEDEENYILNVNNDELVVYKSKFMLVEVVEDDLIYNILDDPLMNSYEDKIDFIVSDEKISPIDAYIDMIRFYERVGYILNDVIDYSDNRIIGIKEEHIKGFTLKHMVR